MISFGLSFLVIVLASVGLGIGVMFGRDPLRGSCGGDQTVSVCPICKQRDEE